MWAESDAFEWKITNINREKFYHGRNNTQNMFLIFSTNFFLLDDPFYVVYATQSNHTRVSSEWILIPPQTKFSKFLIEEVLVQRFKSWNFDCV